MWSEIWVCPSFLWCVCVWNLKLKAKCRGPQWLTSSNTMRNCQEKTLATHWCYQCAVAKTTGIYLRPDMRGHMWDITRLVLLFIYQWHNYCGDHYRFFANAGNDLLLFAVQTLKCDTAHKVKRHAWSGFSVRLMNDDGSLPLHKYLFCEESRFPISRLVLSSSVEERWGSFSPFWKRKLTVSLVLQWNK